MIDIEPVVFDRIARLLIQKYQGITVSDKYESVIASLPYVSIEEKDNYTHQKTQTEKAIENHANILYEVNVYTNGNNAKALCKSISSDIDEAMQSIYFTRTMTSQTPNIDRNIYRVTMRYTGVVNSGKIINGDTVYSIFRR